MSDIVYTLNDNLHRRDVLYEDKYYIQRILRLTESDLKRIIIETLTEILIESA